MMTDRLQISVMSAPLAAIDRRALSQAWYSALHLARSTATAEPLHAPNAPAASPSSARMVRSNVVAMRPATPPKATQTMRTTRSQTVATGAAERRAPQSVLARRIVRAVRGMVRSQSAHSTLRLDENRRRVHLLVQQRGSGVRLVAVCSACARVAVSRALEQARYALALRGVPAESRVVETVRG
jgi:hypothetical protein